ncbi:MAG: cupredoxin domain-containing protein [Dehalococcoidia bacterium]
MFPAALKVLPLAVAALALGASGCGGTASADETIAIHFSRFQPGTITVPAGVPVTITLRNDDPIEHEWIVGLPGVHERHRTGTEPFHTGIPTEVTIPALSTRTTALTFENAGEFEFICHLPGHEEYGMAGTLIVTDG